MGSGCEDARCLEDARGSWQETGPVPFGLAQQWRITETQVDRSLAGVERTRSGRIVSQTCNKGVAWIDVEDHQTGARERRRFTRYGDELVLETSGGDRVRMRQRVW